MSARRVEFRGPRHSICFALGPCSDADVVQATVTVVAGEFQGQFAANMWRLDWIECQAVLRSLNAQVDQPAEASYRFTEPRIHLTFELTPRGRLGVEVDIYRPEPMVHLQFWFEVEPAALSLWIRLVDEALTQFSGDRGG